MLGFLSLLPGGHKPTSPPPPLPMMYEPMTPKLHRYLSKLQTHLSFQVFPFQSIPQSGWFVITFPFTRYERVCVWGGSKHVISKRKFLGEQVNSRLVLFLTWTSKTSLPRLTNLLNNLENLRLSVSFPPASGFTKSPALLHFLVRQVNQGKDARHEPNRCFLSVLDSWGIRNSPVKFCLAVLKQKLHLLELEKNKVGVEVEKSSLLPICWQREELGRKLHFPVAWGRWERMSGESKARLLSKH